MFIHDLIGQKKIANVYSKSDWPPCLLYQFKFPPGPPFFELITWGDLEEIKKIAKELSKKENVNISPIPHIILNSVLKTILRRKRLKQAWPVNIIRISKIGENGVKNLNISMSSYTYRNMFGWNLSQHSPLKFIPYKFHEQTAYS